MWDFFKGEPVHATILRGTVNKESFDLLISEAKSFKSNSSKIRAELPRISINSSYFAIFWYNTKDKNIIWLLFMSCKPLQCVLSQLLHSSLVQ